MVDQDDEGQAEDAEWDRYWLSLGRFVHEFAAFEKSLTGYFWSLTGLGIEYAQALFTDVRVDRLKDLIGRLHGLRRAETKTTEELKEAFSRLTAITKVRNDILHYGPHGASPQDFVATNVMVAHTENRVRSASISPDCLDRMSMDLKKIAAHVLYWDLHGRLPDDLVEKITGEQRRRAWQYTPPQQSQPGTQPRPRSPAQQPPPPPSRE